MDSATSRVVDGVEVQFYGGRTSRRRSPETAKVILEY
jgi:hypothetical protein